MNVVGYTSDNGCGVLVLTTAFADEGGVLATSFADEGGVLSLTTSCADGFVDAVTDEVESIDMATFCISLEDWGSVETTTGRLEFS